MNEHSTKYADLRTEIGYALSDLGVQIDSEKLPKYFDERDKKPVKGGPPPNLGVYGLLHRLGGDFSTLTQELEQYGLTQFSYLRSSRSGICFESVTPRGNPVIVMLRDNPPARAPIPQQLQSLCCYNSKSEQINVEILPKLQVMPDGELPAEQKQQIEEQMQKIHFAITSQEGPASLRYHVVDMAPRNIALASDNRTMFYIDGDGVRSTGANEIGMLVDPNYVNPDGIWRQYQLYEEEHRAFNSPLHQGQGKGLPMEIISEIRPTHETRRLLSFGGPRAEGHKTVRLLNEPERRSSTTPRISLGSNTSRLVDNGASPPAGEGTTTGPLRFPR